MLCLFCVSGAEMEVMLLTVLLVSKALLAGAQFNGYNCDGNFHSRFPGEKLTHNHINISIWLSSFAMN